MSFTEIHDNVMNSEEATASSPPASPQASPISQIDTEFVKVIIKGILIKPFNKQVDKDETIGNFILKLYEEKSVPVVIFAFSVAIDKVHFTKFIGYDFLLDKKFSDYEELNGEIELYAISNFSPKYEYVNVRYPLAYFKKKMSWPPSDNWPEGDPINLAPFLIWDGWGFGPTSVPLKDDNHYYNLMILEYSSNAKIIRKAVNKTGYSLAISFSKGKDPLTNKKLSLETIINIKEASKIVRDKYYETNIDTMIPLPVVKVQYLE